MPPERTRMEELWEREVGGLPPKRFANSVMASKVFPSPSSLISCYGEDLTVPFVLLYTNHGSLNSKKKN
jgi:hypothetical protein